MKTENLLYRRDHLETECKYQNLPLKILKSKTTHKCKIYMNGEDGTKEKKKVWSFLTQR